MTTQKEKNDAVRLLNRSSRTKVEIAQTDPADASTVQDAINEVSSFIKKNARTSYTLIAVRN